jgi:hypothetical protein
MNCTLKMNASTSKLQEALDQINESLKHSPNVCHESVKRLFNLRDSASKLFRINVNQTFAAGASDLSVIFEPSDLLLNLISTLRARNV